MTKYLNKLQPFALMALRVVLGVIMLAHGWSKVSGGIGRHMETVSRIGFPSWMAYFSTGAEFVGGMLLIAGLFTRFAALFVFATMMVAVVKVHWGRLTGDGGMELPLMLAASAFLLMFFGGGPIGADWLVGGKRR